MAAELLLTFTMEETLNRVISIAAEGIRFAWGLEGQLQRLKESLTMIQATLQDAATRPVTDKSVKLWLERLQDVAYDAEDVLDEMLRKDQKKGKVRDFFSLHNPVAFRLIMGRKVKKIKEALDEIREDAAGSGLGLTFLQHEDRAQEVCLDLDRERDSFLDSSEVVGREDDMATGVPGISPPKKKMFGYALLNKEDENEQLLQPPVSPSTPRVRPSSESAEVTVGTMDMEPTTNTGPSTNARSNPSLGNAASSCKSKTAEWALLVTSVVLEATSAIFEQLGYPLTSMVMAFVALLLSILDLIHKARQRGITCDWCFYRQTNRDSQNRKPFASLVEYFGLAGALWQCSFTTVGYHYTHQKLVNPIKLCLLPFIFALCVLISKVVKSSQHERLDSNAHEV